jgi:N-acetylglucosamine-6-phosphate deacetylase
VPVVLRVPRPEEEQLGCDVIADGAHVHPDWLRARARQSRLILISDRIDVPEAGIGHPAWLAAERLTSDGVAWRLPDGRLAGSLLTLDAAIRNVASWHVMSPHDAIAACTLRPAGLLGVERQHGTLRAGARADLVALSDAGEVVATWVGGRELFRAKPR